MNNQGLEIVTMRVTSAARKFAERKKNVDRVAIISWRRRGKMSMKGASTQSLKR